MLLSSLRIGVRSGRTNVKLKTLLKAERREYEKPGAYGLPVEGSTRGLVRFLAVHVLTAESVMGALDIVRIAYAASCALAPAASANPVRRRVGSGQTAGNRVQLR
jgi:hypothetical protein